MCWITKDKDGMLCVYNDKPYKFNNGECWRTEDLDKYLEIDSKDFPDVTFENSPIEITLASIKTYIPATKGITKVKYVKKYLKKLLEDLEEFEDDSTFSILSKYGDDFLKAYKVSNLQHTEIKYQDRTVYFPFIQFDK